MSRYAFPASRVSAERSDALTSFAFPFTAFTVVLIILYNAEVLFRSCLLEILNVSCASS